MFKKNFFALSLIGIFSTIPIAFLSVSCSSKNNENYNDSANNDEITTPPVEDNGNGEINQDSNLDINLEYKLSIKWLEGFRDKKTKFLNKNQDIQFEIEEEIFNNNLFNIQYVGDSDNIPCFSLFDKKINKFYIASVKAKYKNLFANFSYAKIKNFLSLKIIDDYKNQMIIYHNICDNDFFIPIDPSDNSLTFIKNEIINFKSSWGVGNSATRKSIFNINISSKKIREMLFGLFERNYDNFFVNEVKATDLYILPKVIGINYPINYFDFNIESLRNNENDEYFNLTKDELSKINLDIPGKGNSKPRDWTGTVDNQTLSGKICDDEFIGGASYQIPMMIDPDNNNFENLLDRINNDKVNKYVDHIIRSGKKISINLKKDFNENDNLFSFEINTKIKSGANSGYLFGDQTSVGIYDVSAIQKMSISFVEYKKF